MPGPRSVIVELEANPKSAHGILCLGEFVRTAGLDKFEANRPEASELGGREIDLPGEAYSRGEAYKTLIADPRTPPRDRAYALYRAVNCYAPANSNECGGRDVPLSQRKAWFNELKSRFGSTSWSQSLKFYW